MIQAVIGILLLIVAAAVVLFVGFWFVTAALPWVLLTWIVAAMATRPALQVPAAILALVAYPFAGWWLYMATAGCASIK